MFTKIVGRLYFFIKEFLSMKILRHLNSKKASCNIGQKDEIAMCNVNTFFCDCSRGGLIKGSDVSRALKGIAGARHIETTDQTCTLM